MRRLGLLSIVFAALLFGLACYPELEPTPGTSLLCESDDACPTRQSCISGLCGVPESEPRELAFRLIPTPSSQYRPQLVAAALIDPSAGVDIGMEASVEVVGKVARGRDGTGVAGTLVFTRQNARTPDTVQVSVGTDGAYEALLSPGRYQVSMLPDGELVPPFVWTELDFRLDTVWDFTMPGDAALRTVTVTTNLPAGSTFGERAGDLLAARILAVSRDTGVSSTIVTSVPRGSDDGSLGASLNVFANTGDYDLRIAPASPDSIVPEATFEKAFRCEDSCFSTLPGSDGAELVSLEFGQDFSALSTQRFVLNLPGAELRPNWEGTRAIVTRELERGKLTVRPEISAEGEFFVEALSGDYTIDILTPADSPLASRRFDDVAFEGSGDQTVLEMKTKRALAGKISDIDGASLPEARIEVRPTADNDTRFAKPLVATTGEDGTFKLWLEPGDYWVSVIPLNPGLPRYVTRVDDQSTSSSLDWRLREPTVVFGSVFGAPPQAEETDDAWKPVADVTVQVLERRDGELIVLGEGATAKEGDFRIAIPTATTN